MPTPTSTTETPADIEANVTIPVPEVPYCGARHTTASVFRVAARNLRHRYSPGGSNTRATVAELLDRTADALGDATAPQDLGDLRHAPDGRPLDALTYLERTSLPAVYHQPFWDGAATRARWTCAACWTDGHADTWPCRPARRDGGPIAAYAGLDHC